MPLFDNDMDVKDIPGIGNFQYSATRTDNLKESDYTLVVICIDKSGSTEDFAKDLLEMLKVCVLACKNNPRVNRNVMLRVIAFNREVTEVHGFKPLNSINLDDYEEFDSKGLTALYDATFSGIGSILDYSKTLYGDDRESNGVCFIITDGLNNRGSSTPTMIKNKINEALKGEELSSLTTVLIQLKDPNNPNPEAERLLKKFRVDADISAFLDVNDVTPETLAKVGRLMSQSVSVISQSLQTGQPVNTQSLTI